MAKSNPLLLIHMTHMLILWVIILYLSNMLQQKIYIIQMLLTPLNGMGDILSHLVLFLIVKAAFVIQLLQPAIIGCLITNLVVQSVDTDTDYIHRAYRK